MKPRAGSTPPVATSRSGNLDELVAPDVRSKLTRHTGKITCEGGRGELEGRRLRASYSVPMSVDDGRVVADIDCRHVRRLNAVAGWADDAGGVAHAQDRAEADGRPAGARGIARRDGAGSAQLDDAGLEGLDGSARVVEDVGVVHEDDAVLKCEEPAGIRPLVSVVLDGVVRGQAEGGVPDIDRSGPDEHAGLRVVLDDVVADHRGGGLMDADAVATQRSTGGRPVAIDRGAADEGRGADAQVDSRGTIARHGDRSVRRIVQQADPRAAPIPDRRMPVRP